jgi:hypothetical protein
MSSWKDKATLIEDVAKELGLESPHVVGGQGNTYFTLQWIVNEEEMHLPIPGGHVLDDRSAVKKYIEEQLDAGKAKKAPR